MLSAFPFHHHNHHCRRLAAGRMPCPGHPRPPLRSTRRRPCPDRDGRQSHSLADRSNSRLLRRRVFRQRGPGAHCQADSRRPRLRCARRRQKDKVKDPPKKRSRRRQERCQVRRPDTTRTRCLPSPRRNQHYYRYTANLDNLPFNSDVTYRVKLGNKIIREATFRTRATEDRTVRCVMVGDLAQGRNAQKEIAYRISLEKPEFLVALGDIVYPSGRVNQYMAYYWGTYNNVAKPGMKTGAPLMASVPFYPVLGNHDISAKLSKTPDALGIYLFLLPAQERPRRRTLEHAARRQGFRLRKVPGRDRRQLPVHRHLFVRQWPGPLCRHQHQSPPGRAGLSANGSSTISNRPRRNGRSSASTFPASRVRVRIMPSSRPGTLQPIFEECGVDMTFARPRAQLSADGAAQVHAQIGGHRQSPGRQEVSGQRRLHAGYQVRRRQEHRPNGIIHIVAGGGGASLYGPGLDKTAEALKKDYGPDNYVDFTARMVVDKHSFVVLDIVAVPPGSAGPRRQRGRTGSHHAHEIATISLQALG